MTYQQLTGIAGKVLKLDRWRGSISSLFMAHKEGF